MTENPIPQPGTLYLVPSSLGEGSLFLPPPSTQALLAQIRHYYVEDEKAARRFVYATLRHSSDYTDAIAEIREASFWVPMPAKKSKNGEDERELLAPVLAGANAALLSDAGCPAVADPGTLLVRAAHRLGIRVVPVVGPSSILLALMASGLSGQHFSFRGYLPRERENRHRALLDIERTVQRFGETILFIETPYRNRHVLEDAVLTLNAETMLCIATDLTLPTEFIRTQTVSQWRKQPLPDIHNRPTVFVVGV